MRFGPESRLRNYKRPCVGSSLLWIPSVPSSVLCLFFSSRQKNLFNVWWWKVPFTMNIFQDFAAVFLQNLVEHVTPVCSILQFTIDLRDPL